MPSTPAVYALPLAATVPAARPCAAPSRRLRFGRALRAATRSRSPVSSRLGQLSGRSSAAARLLDDPERRAQQRLDAARLGEQPLALALARRA